MMRIQFRACMASKVPHFSKIGYKKYYQSCLLIHFTMSSLSGHKENSLSSVSEKKNVFHLFDWFNLKRFCKTCLYHASPSQWPVGNLKPKLWSTCDHSMGLYNDTFGYSLLTPLYFFFTFFFLLLAFVFKFICFFIIYICKNKIRTLLKNNRV